MSNRAPAPSPSWMIGSSPDCDLVVNQPVVSARHCRLTLSGDQYVLEDLGSTNGTFVNGYRLQPNAPVYVTPTDALTLGRTFPMPWPSQAPPSRSDPTSDAQVITIGRDPDCEVRLDYPMISWQHARVTRIATQWVIEDLNSRNGTALNQFDNKIERAVLQPTDDIFLGSYKIPASKILRERHLTQGEGAFERVRFQGDRMIIGRDPSADCVLNYPMISWRHAALERAPGGIYVQDLDSRNGTYVNGTRISARTLVQTGDEIGLGSFRFQMLEDGALAKREYIGNVTIEINAVTVNAPSGDRLLDPVSLTVFPSELVALMGPAGAGKTTLLKAMNGYTSPADGAVLFNGQDLYHFYDRFRLQLSYVPQDDIVHAQLTVREALYFSAKLRTDLRDDEIERRIDKVLESLGIHDKKNTIIGSPERKVLSGGQRKRVNIAMELIADAPVIFLDEPTSGLSSYDAENVVQVLKQLSLQGNTIIATIHQPSLDVFKQFDSLIMLSRDRGGRGALAYFGPAYPDSVEFFDPENAQSASKQGKECGPEMLLSGLAKRSTADWVGTYGQSRYKKLFVEDRSGKVPSKTNAAAESAVRGFGFGQWWMLVRRNLLLKIRDRAQLAILLAQAPLFGLLLGLVFRGLNYTDADGFQATMKHASGIEFLMVVAAIWFGCNNAARDIVGEWTIFQRERMVSLKLPSYLFSKVTIAALLGLLQCVLLLGIVTLMCGLKGNFFLTLGILYLSSLVGAAIGLCVSARAPTTEAAIAMLPLVLLPVIALGGGLTPISEMHDLMRDVSIAIPSRWGFEADMLVEAKKSHYKSEQGSQTSQSTQRNHRPINFEKAHKAPDPDQPNRVQDEQCDLADVSFPRAEKETCIPTKDGDCPCHLVPHSEHPLARNSLLVSFSVLGGMLLFWLSVALAFLRMRDIQ